MFPASCPHQRPLPRWPAPALPQVFADCAETVDILQILGSIALIGLALPTLAVVPETFVGALVYAYRAIDTTSKLAYWIPELAKGAYTGTAGNILITAICRVRAGISGARGGLLAGAGRPCAHAGKAHAARRHPPPPQPHSRRA